MCNGDLSKSLKISLQTSQSVKSFFRKVFPFYNLRIKTLTDLIPNMNKSKHKAVLYKLGKSQETSCFLNKKKIKGVKCEILCQTKKNYLEFLIHRGLTYLKFFLTKRGPWSTNAVVFFMFFFKNFIDFFHRLPKVVTQIKERRKNLIAKMQYFYLGKTICSDTISLWMKFL